MMKPTVHLNGTGAERLLEQYTEAGRAVQEAIDALAGAAPNARDYYVQGPDAFACAAREHAARATALRGVLADLEALALHVAGID
jgi:hypothetical protein